MLWLWLLHDYIVDITKQDPVWLFHLQGKKLFSEGQFTEVSVRRFDSRGDFFLLFNGQKCGEESVKHAGWQALLHI